MNTSVKLNVQLNPPFSSLRTICLLISRRLLRFYRDKTDLSITLLQAPILGFLFFLVFQKVITAGQIKAEDDISWLEWLQTIFWLSRNLCCNKLYLETVCYSIMIPCVGAEKR